MGREGGSLPILPRNLAAPGHCADRQDVHDRRPLLLAQDLAQEWLDPAITKEQAEQLALNLSEPSQVFEWYRVSTAVGNVRGPELIHPIQ